MLLCRLGAAFLKQLRVSLELAAHDVFQTCCEITSEVLGANGACLHQTVMTHDLLSGHTVDVGENQDDLPRLLCTRWSAGPLDSDASRFDATSQKSGGDFLAPVPQEAPPFVLC